MSVSVDDRSPEERTLDWLVWLGDQGGLAPLVMQEETRAALVRDLSALSARAASAERELDFTHDRGDHLIYRREWEEFERWQRGAGTDALNRLVAAEADLQAAKEALGHMHARLATRKIGVRMSGKSQFDNPLVEEVYGIADSILARLSTDTPACSGSLGCDASRHTHVCFRRRRDELRSPVEHPGTQDGGEG